MNKIAHLTSVHRRYDQRILWRECVSLREQGYDVSLIVNDNQPDETLKNGIKILSTGFVPEGRRQRMTEGVRRVYELGLAQDANIYHLHDPELLRIALKLKKYGKKVIFDSHEFYGEQIKTKQYLPSVARNLISGLYFAYETFICKRIDGVIVPARYDGKETFLHRSKRFAYVANYPRMDEYQEIVSSPFEERKGVCYSGGLTKERGISVLAEACKQAGVTLVLAGGFSSSDYEREICNQYQEVVNYQGFLPLRRKMFELYSNCAIGACIPLAVGQYSKLDTLFTKVYEYMAMSMPVILSDFPYNRKLIEKYHFGVVADSTDISAVASKIAWLIEHPKDAEEMGKLGKRLLEDQFTWERGAEPELLRLYREIENDV